MILDASVILAMAQEEPTVPWLLEKLEANAAEFLRMSWVNIAEAGMTFRRLHPQAADRIEPILDDLGVLKIDLDAETVRLAVAARSRFPLNFGDCFAYAHAKLRNEALITLDADFLKTDLPAVIHPARG